MTVTTPGTWLADRAVLRIGGDDAPPFLQGLVTQDIGTVTPDTPRWAALLSAQGKALFDFILWADGEDFLIDGEAAQTEALARRLALYRLRRPITIAPDPACPRKNRTPSPPRGVRRTRRQPTNVAPPAPGSPRPSRVA